MTYIKKAGVYSKNESKLEELVRDLIGVIEDGGGGGGSVGGGGYNYTDILNSISFTLANMYANDSESILAELQAINLLCGQSKIILEDIFYQVSWCTSMVQDLNTLSYQNELRHIASNIELEYLAGSPASIPALYNAWKSSNPSKFVHSVQMDGSGILITFNSF